jgi:hypothetical protein
MNRDTLKILVDVLRVFIDAAPGAGMLTASAVTEKICLALQRRKEKEKKNTHGYVLAALRALKAKQILFESIDATELGSQSKRTEAPRLFGFTNPAIDYLTTDNHLRGYSVRSEAVLVDMLIAFNVIAQPHGSRVTVPAALVETVRAIEQKAHITAPKTQPTEEDSVSEPVLTADNNVQRLVATVRNRSDEWPTNSTPKDLLGGLLALDQSGETNADVQASQAKLLWPDSKRPNYIAVCTFLRQHNLICSFKECKSPNNPNGTRPYGIKLTDLGRAVAVAGEFKDERPSEERWNTRSQNNGKKSTLLKKDKKRMNADDENSPATGPREPISIADFHTMMSHFKSFASSLEQRLAAAEQAINARDKVPPTNNQTAAASVETAGLEYDEQETMRLVLKDAVRFLVASFKSLIDNPEELEHDEKPATVINSSGLYLALTEIEQVVHGIKAYVSECLYTHTDVDLEMIERYAENYTAAAKVLPTKHTLPVMATKLMVKRFLTGDKAVRRTKWNRGTAAKT